MRQRAEAARFKKKQPRRVRLSSRCSPKLNHTLSILITGRTLSSAHFARIPIYNEGIRIPIQMRGFGCLPLLQHPGTLSIAMRLRKTRKMVVQSTANAAAVCGPFGHSSRKIKRSDPGFWRYASSAIQKVH